MPPLCKEMFSQNVGSNIQLLERLHNVIYQVKKGKFSKLCLFENNDYLLGKNHEKCYPHTSTGKFGWCYTGYTGSQVKIETQKTP